jgi:hypothetical protein
MIDLTRLPAAEAERLAYAEGFTGTADLFARIAQLEHAAQVLLNVLHLYAERDLGDEIEDAMENLENLIP